MNDDIEQRLADLERRVKALEQTTDTNRQAFIDAVADAIDHLIPDVGIALFQEVGLKAIGRAVSATIWDFISGNNSNIISNNYGLHIWPISGLGPGGDFNPLYPTITKNNMAMHPSLEETAPEVSSPNDVEYPNHPSNISPWQMEEIIENANQNLAQVSDEAASRVQSAGGMQQGMVAAEGNTQISRVSGAAAGYRSILPTRVHAQRIYSFLYTCRMWLL